MKGFIDFLREKGVVGLAVGFILGGAVSKVVTSAVSDLINPALGALMGSVALNEAVLQIGSVTIAWGNFVAAAVDFIVIALVVYIGVKVLKLDQLDKRPKA